ncbi:YbhB/YbcL family Raf kinase inhibitor-like protein [Taibaiella lutea]|uniref:YbhB/YbcL family Raf kinase inhibitor-like protein n=1 Tax=Taibaiella lutea TaxID=2608001 RepID=A0A5M6CAV6_9BACT|nr:YbhB/YbcL family Raf kinase inhibitor-like protein [Taibaiella lutea]KAA5532308.1 YbhB/YbcL family Raf kinase inhibitor-like protein [Taibaiella lutea]
MDINMQRLQVTSTEFEEEGWIPSQFTCEGEGTNPPIKIRSIPAEAQSLVLLLEDPDAPGGTFDHWVMWNIDVNGDIAADSCPGICGLNSKGTVGYYPPCPPEGSHRYIFVVFALNKNLPLQEGSSKKQLLESIEGAVIAKGTLTGRYEKQDKKA